MNKAEFVNRIGVQSYCFREFKDHKTIAQMVREAGLDRIELCAVHVNFDESGSFDEIIGIYQEAGVNIGSIGVERFRNDPKAEMNRFEFAKKAGAEVISANFFPDTFDEAHRTAAKMSKEYGIKLAIHNHGGYHWLGSGEMLEHVFNVVDPAIGLCIDTAWALDAKQEPVEMMEKFADRLYGIHFKDFTFQPNRQGVDVPVGEGNLDLKAALDLLEKIDYQGYAVYEYEGDPSDPLPAVKKCVDNMKAAVSA